jgi:hypothetical protein
MKTINRTLVMAAAAVALLGAGVSASAHSMQGLITVGNGVTGRVTVECGSYDPIYTFARAWASFGGPVVCQVSAYKNAQWTVGTGNCDTAQFQVSVLRNSHDDLAWGTWVAARGAISYAVLLDYDSMVDTGNGWSPCEGRDILGYSMISN